MGPGVGGTAGVLRGLRDTGDGAPIQLVPGLPEVPGGGADSGSRGCH